MKKELYEDGKKAKCQSGDVGFSEQLMLDVDLSCLYK